MSKLTIADIIGGDVGMMSGLRSYLDSLRGRERELRVIVAKKAAEYEYEKNMPIETRRSTAMDDSWDKFNGFKGRLNECRRIIKQLEALVARSK